MKMNLINLPHDILILLREYLCHAKIPEHFMRPRQSFVIADSFENVQNRNDEETEWGGFLNMTSDFFEKFQDINDEETEWRNFLNTTSVLYELKRITIVLVLSGVHAITFLEDEDFRARVESLISDRRKQLHFRIQDSSFLEKDYFHWNYSQGISIANIRHTFINTTAFSNTYGLTLRRTSERFIYNFSCLLYLRVSECIDLKTLRHLPVLQRLCIELCCFLETISDLPALKQLWIYDCFSFSSLSVPPLEVLEIINCQSLTLSKKFINSTKMHLTLQGDTSLEGTLLANLLNHLESIEIVESRLHFDLSCTSLAYIGTIAFTRCPNLLIADLLQLHSLYLWNCHSPTIDFKTLPALRILLLKGCQDLFQLEFYKVADNFQSLVRVELIDCEDLKKVIIQRTIRVLIIKSTKGPEVNITESGHVQCLTINSCD